MVVVRWKERKEPCDYESGYGYGPRFHNRFSDAVVVEDDGHVFVLEKRCRDKAVASDVVMHIQSWGEEFGIKIERRAKNRKEKANDS
jgi:hypothetical protein